MNRTVLRNQLVVHEGLRLKAYADSVGKTTIGVGRNLDDKGISGAEAMHLLDNDITDVWKECSARLASFGFGALNDARQHVLLDMVFNLGIGGVLKFKHMLAAVAAQDFASAAKEMRASKWAEQVGERAQTLARMMETGESAA